MRKLLQTGLLVAALAAGCESSKLPTGPGALILETSTSTSSTTTTTVDHPGAALRGLAGGVAELPQRPERHDAVPPARVRRDVTAGQPGIVSGGLADADHLQRDGHLEHPGRSHRAGQGRLGRHGRERRLPGDVDGEPVGLHGRAGVLGAGLQPTPAVDGGRGRAGLPGAAALVLVLHAAEVRRGAARHDERADDDERLHDHHERPGVPLHAHADLHAGRPRSVATSRWCVSTQDKCSWAAQSTVDWITIQGRLTGEGEATITYIVGPHPGPQRNGALMIARHHVLRRAERLVDAGGRRTRAVRGADAWRAEACRASRDSDVAGLLRRRPSTDSVGAA